MARPLKVGIDYFPFDVDMDQDDKLRMVKSKYGLMGMGTVSMILTRIYKNGYYYHWTDREQELFCGDYRDEVDVVNNIVNECIKWGFFNKNIYEEHQVLTSQGIQKRYLLAVERRKDKHIIDKYWLLEKTNNEDNNRVNVINNQDNEDNNLVNVSKSTQSKVKESKVNKNKEDIKHSGTKVPVAKKFIQPTIEELTTYCYERGNRVDPEEWMDHYTSNGWKVGKNPMKDWKASIRTWEKKSYSKPYQNKAERDEEQLNRIKRKAEGGEPIAIENDGARSSQVIDLNQSEFSPF